MAPERCATQPESTLCTMLCIEQQYIALTPQRGSTSPVHDAELGECQTDAPCICAGRPVLDGVLATVGLCLQ